ncbi:MAG TPA: PRC-barrel domain-containing protein [Candidatus Acidoferrum sp.]|nr:PRC-barrel domain-containing protein [Candidatus Acidoferrum sp.]
MLQSVKHLYGIRLAASDGDLGHVKDFYFNDQSWAVRYLVADTGNWLPGRQVLLSPHAFNGLHHDEKLLGVNLTREQIKNSPSIATHKPVSRQYEELYHRYYGWPYYWEGDGLWGGTRSLPVLELPPKFDPAQPPAASGPKPVRADAHLRSTLAVTGYHLQATDGIVGHISDFLVDDKSWAIGELVIKVGHRFTGKEVRIPAGQVAEISYDSSKVHVKLSTDAVERSPAWLNGSTPPESGNSKKSVASILAP